MSTPAHESIGTRLTAARTAAGLTTAAAAARLRCDETLPVALEAGPPAGRSVSANGGGWSVHRYVSAN